MPRGVTILLLALSGCFLSNASNTKKLTDSVHEMNKAVRWGSLGAAVGMVEPGYRDRFMETHRHWGQVVQLADTDVVQLEIAPDVESAVAVVAYQWYQADTMSLYQTVVRQRWLRVDGGYALAGESVVGGDPRLLHPQAAAPAPAPAAPPDQMSLMGLE